MVRMANEAGYARPNLMQTTDLYHDYSSGILRYLKRFLSDTQAEDLTQDIFIKADKGLRHFRGDASPKTWLYRIATNTLRDFLRSKSHRMNETTIHIPVQELEQIDGSISSDVSTEQGAIKDEMSACIREFILRLPENYSTVLVLSDLEGHTGQEVADILELSLEAVKVRLHRARTRLKEELSHGCDFSVNTDNTLQCQRKEE